jgi:peptide/nickel transport system substrate-binding protein
MSIKKWFVVFSVFVVFSLLVSACGGTTAAQPSVVKIGWAGSPDTLNPGAALLSESFTVFECIYSTLYKRQLDNTYKPDLVENVSASPDYLTYTYTIRSGVKFHDGTPLTAKDVAFTFNFYHNHEDFPYMYGYTANFESITAPDDTTVVLKLAAPIPNIEYVVAYLYVLPEHIWSTYDNDKAMEYENLDLIGSGPFKLLEYRQNEIVHLGRFADYYTDKPKVDEVVFQTFENQDALVQAIRTGQVDMITEMPSTAVATLQDTENVAMAIGNPFAPDVTDILINQVDPANCPEDGVCSGHPALRDHTVRMALAYATNKAQLIQVVTLGLATPGLTLIPIGLGHWYDDQIQDYPFDLAKANSLLDDAGYLDTDGDGIRQMPDGSNPLNFRLNWPSDSTVAPRLAEQIAQTWGQIGIKAELQAVDPDALSSLCCPTFDYDLIIWGWGSDPDPSFLLSVMRTEDIPTGMNETGYSNPAYDDLFTQQSQELDPTKRQEIVWQMQQMVFDDVVYVIPFYTKATQAYRTDTFQGWITDQTNLALEDITSLLVIEPVKK